MSPFDQNIDNDAGHTIDQDDLIAFHLHELSSPQERALHRVLQTNPALQSESLAIATTLRAFSKYEAPLPLDTAALDRHWQALRPTLTPYVPPTIVPRSLFPRSVFHRWALPALAGSVLATTALIVTLHHDRHTAPVTIATTQSPTSTTPSIPPAAPFNAAPTSASPTSSPTLTASTQRPRLNNNQLDSQINNPSSSSPSAPTQTALAKPSTSLFPTEPLAPPTQVSPATNTNTATATAESPTSQSTNTTSSPSQPPTQLSKVRPPKIHHPHPADLTLAIFGNLTPSSTSTYDSSTGTPLVITSRLPLTESAVGALASFHQQFNPWLGYRITTTYSHPTFQYSYNSSSALTGVIEESNTATDSIYELSGTYIVQGPHHSRLTTYAEAGAGLLAFILDNDNQTGTAADKAFRPAAIVGVTADIALTKHWALHTGYRALLYNSPAFYSPIATIPAAFTFSSNPIVGVTYNFGARGSD